SHLSSPVFDSSSLSIIHICYFVLSPQLESVFKSIEMLSEEEKLMKLSTLKLRYFTPREIANLHGFPPEFGTCL
uniref:Uncharacterized protein n=1 Tax=Chelydra serpentina TaxID=8475 RepID=A0A8C3TM85_CHESE